jgi:hypothetical protein
MPRSLNWASAVLAICPAFGQTTLNLSEDLVRLGIAPTNMAPNQPSQDSSPRFVVGVEYAQNHQIPTVIADAGAYYFSNALPGCHVNVQALNGITIDLQGSDLYFEDVTTPSICTSGTNITLQNFTVDYLNLPFTQLLITSVNPAQGQIQVSTQPGYAPPSGLNYLFPSGSVGIGYIFRDGQPWPLSDRILLSPPFVDNQITFLPSTASSVIAQIRPGDIFVLTADNNGNPSITRRRAAHAPFVT